LTSLRLWGIWKDIISAVHDRGLRGARAADSAGGDVTNKMVKRLGFPRWKRLHRLAYVAASWRGAFHLAA